MNQPDSGQYLLILVLCEISRQKVHRSQPLSAELVSGYRGFRDAISSILLPYPQRAVRLSSQTITLVCNMMKTNFAFSRTLVSVVKPAFLQILIAPQKSDHSNRGGEWFFKNSGSRKILVEFHGSRSLVF